ncbi:MAG: CbrC family protein [Acidimicrobiia bacterium]
MPTFRYHPDPIATGSVEPSPAECRACDQTRGFIYVGPVYAENELVDAFCPWCIADGAAAREFDAEFTDVGRGVPAEVPAAVLDEIARRTPGFHTWQEAHWLYHCGDGCAFLGEVGRSELSSYEDALESLHQEASAWGWTDRQAAVHVDSLARGGSPAAYLFRCLVCGTHLAYSEFD